MSPPQEALLKFVLEARSTKNITFFMDSPLIFALGQQLKLFCQTIFFLENLFFCRSCFKKVEAGLLRICTKGARSQILLPYDMQQTDPNKDNITKIKRMIF
jgi:hypothetical protein